MHCPHCLRHFHESKTTVELGRDCDADWKIVRFECPACQRFVLTLIGLKPPGPACPKGFNHISLIRPRAPSRAPLPKEVPNAFAEDYREACLVLAESPKASAALSRRCLQHLLREKAKVPPADLAAEIQAVIDGGSLPSHLVESIDAVRNIGNFAAHPIKSRSTGEVVPVEPGEAEWNLDVLEALFDFYFVQPALIAAKRAALNQKLRDAGKPELKG